VRLAYRLYRYFKGIYVYLKYGDGSNRRLRKPAINNGK